MTALYSSLAVAGFMLVVSLIGFLLTRSPQDPSETPTDRIPVVRPTSHRLSRTGPSRIVLRGRPSTAARSAAQEGSDV